MVKRKTKTIKKKDTKLDKKAQEKKAKKKIQRAKPILIDLHWRGWKEIFLAGTEWDIYKHAYEVNWDFDHLESFLKNYDEEAKEQKQLFCFGGTEPQHLMTGETVVIPVIIVIEAPMGFEPPNFVGVTSVQRVKEDIVPLSEFNMSWVPQPQISKQSGNIHDIYYLQCRTRHARAKYMKANKKLEYTYVIPYMIDPETWETELIQPDGIPGGTAISVEGHDRSIQVAYAPNLYESLDEYVEELCEDNELDKEKLGENIKKSLQEQMEKVQKDYQEERESKQKMIDDITPTQKDAMKKCRYLKFYPQNEQPPIGPWKSTLINRYYGHTQNVFPSINNNQ